MLSVMARNQPVKSLIEWKEASGKSWQELGDAAAMSRSNFKKYVEGDIPNPRVDVAYRIAQALGVEITQVADWQPNNRSADHDMN